MSRYVVYYVLEDANVVESCNTSDPFVALCWMEKDRERFKAHRHHHHGVFDPDEPEDGDLDIEEIVHEYNGDIRQWRADQRELRRSLRAQREGV